MPAIFVTERTEVLTEKEEEENAEIDPLLLTIALEPEREICYQNINEEPTFVSIEQIKNEECTPVNGYRYRTSNLLPSDKWKMKLESELLIENDEQSKSFINEETRTENHKNVESKETRSENHKNCKIREINSFDYPSENCIKMEPGNDCSNDFEYTSMHPNKSGQYSREIDYLHVSLYGHKKLKKKKISKEKQDEEKKNKSKNICPQCNCQFPYQNMVRTHLKYFCAFELRFECPYCEYKAKTRSSVRSHVRLKHPTKLVRVIDLTKTSQTPKEAAMSSIYVRGSSKHNPKKWKYLCDRCQQGFSSRRCIIAHLQYICGIEQKYGCPYCRYRSRRYHCSFRHVRTVHKDEVLNIIKYERT